MTLEEKVEFFVANGWIALPAAFSAAQAAPYVGRAAERMAAMSPPDRRDATKRPLGWTLPYERCFRLAEFAPAAWELIVALLGGADRIAQGAEFDLSDGFVVALPNARGWKPAASAGFRWHMDRDDGPRIRLDAMQHGLVVYGLWNDVAVRGGGTFLAPGAIGPLARYLLRHPGGVELAEIPFSKLLEEGDPRFFEMTGAVGTIYLAHPLLVHAPSLNASRAARFLSVKKVGLSRPLDLSGVTAGSCPAARATRRASAAAGRPARR